MLSVVGIGKQGHPYIAAVVGGGSQRRSARLAGTGSVLDIVSRARLTDMGPGPINEYTRNSPYHNIRVEAEIMTRQLVHAYIMGSALLLLLPILAQAPNPFKGTPVIVQKGVRMCIN